MNDFLSQVYSADGEFLFKFGSHGEGNGQFNAPTGVAVDANGNIIVADWGNSRIQVDCYIQASIRQCGTWKFVVIGVRTVRSLEKQREKSALNYEKYILSHCNSFECE